MKGTRSSMLSANLLWRNHTNDMLRRLGDLRLAKENSSIFVKYQGGETKYDGQDNSGKEVDITQKYNIAQVGYDKKIGDYTLGVAIDHGSSSDTYFGKGDILLNNDRQNVLTGSGKVHMTGLSLYGTKMQNDGSYLDLIAKIGQVKSDYDVTTSMRTDSLHGNYKTMAYSISGEYGKRIYHSDGVYFELSVELTLSKVGDKDYTVKSEKGIEMNIHQTGMSSSIARLGVALGKESENGHTFLKLALAHEFSGDVKTAFAIEKSKESKEISLDFKDTWLDLELGTSYRMSDNGYVYGTFTKNFGAKLENTWRLDAGVRFAI